MKKCSNYRFEGQFTRREFLKTGASLGGLLLLSLYGAGFASSFRKLLSGPASQRAGGLVLLPGHGRLFVASDFHTRYADFEKWLERTFIVERIRNGEDVYGLIVGDAVDRKPGDSFSEDEGDVRIVERIMEIQDFLDEDEERFLFITGNHEHRCVSIYERLITEEEMTPSNQQQLVKNLWDGENGSYYQQFNFVSRMNEERYSYLKKLPAAVLTENGIVGIHAGPSRSLTSPKDIIGLNETVVDEILWSRPSEVRKDGYDCSDLAGFLQRMQDSTLVVSGHTPLSYLPEELVRDNVGDYGGHQIILATSYGSDPVEKSYLVLDLKTSYGSTDELRAGEEIMLLEPSVSRSSRIQPVTGYRDRIMASNSIDRYA